MLLALPLIAGLMLGLLLGGSFGKLASVPIRFGWLFVLGLVLQLALFTPLTDTQSWDIRYGHWFYVTSLLMVLAALLLNVGRLQWPVVVMAIGAGLNLLVILANGGAMPVDLTMLSQAYGHQLVANVIHHSFAINVTPMTRSTVFALLGDRIGVAGTVYSVGDFTLGLGVFLVAVFEMNRGGFSLPAKIRRHAKQQSIPQAA